MYPIKDVGIDATSLNKLKPDPNNNAPILCPMDVTDDQSTAVAKDEKVSFSTAWNIAPNVSHRDMDDTVLCEWCVVCGVWR